ncbi:carboxylesterase family protein, partial [Rhizobium johnstonii]|uniref:carboxylesterase family protein n=1 Tax=Rhizobium johnstonii TaxID=3019933 RepID=UPI003F97A211
MMPWRSAGDDPMTVRVAGGLARGVRESNTRVWRGIPYAAPPVGALRFRAPFPVVPWVGFRDCSRYGDIAQQTMRRLPLSPVIP